MERSQKQGNHLYHQSNHHINDIDLSKKGEEAVFIEDVCWLIYYKLLVECYDLEPMRAYLERRDCRPNLLN